MAPGAQLYLFCIRTELDLEQAESQAHADGVRIINHSVAWFNSSRGDGTGGIEDTDSPDATVARARADGILWVNAAGNYATQHWSGTFTADTSFPEENDFASGQTLDSVSIPQGETDCAYLKWDDWPVTSNDYDLYLFDEDSGQFVTSFVPDTGGGTDDQSDGLAPPLEEFCYDNQTSDTDFGLMIVNYSAASSPRLDLFWIGSSGLEFATAPGSIIEPASSPDALAVGADCWQTQRPRFLQLAGPDDRRPHRPGPARPRQRLVRGVRRRHGRCRRLRVEWLHGHLCIGAPRRRGGSRPARAGPEPHRPGARGLAGGTSACPKRRHPRGDRRR